MQRPVVEYDADLVPEYSPEWGPSWSSQKTACPQCCARQETCNMRSCGEARIFYERCILDSDSFPISNLVDGNDETVYKPGCQGCGRQWFVVGIEEPLYVKRVALFLSGVEGHIASIHGAEEYSGKDTEWEEVWAADEEALRPRDVLSTVEWAPPLCPHYRHPMQWFRVEYDTSNMTALPSFNRIKVTGSLTPHSSTIHNEDGKLLYEPLPGITALDTVDSIVVRGSDCAVWSSPLTVELMGSDESVSSGDQNGSSISDESFGERQVAVVPLRIRTRVAVDLEPAATHLRPFLLSTTAGTDGENDEPSLDATTDPSSCSESDFNVTLEAPKDDDGVVVFRADTGEVVQPGEEAVLGLGGGDGVLVEVDSFQPEFLYFLASYSGVTYRLQLELHSECPANSSMFECARSSDDCIPDCESGDEDACLHQARSDSSSTRIVFDPWKRKCVYASNDDNSDNISVADGDTSSSESDAPTVVAFTAGIVVALLLILLLVLVWLKRKGLIQNQGPPRQGDMVTLVTTDIHGSTTLWDSYPEEVAHGIALHHECLRASLKKCNGYEIATEGDSFKCAFSSPEDAVCWSVVSQLDLLCAQWSSEIEDGGHEALVRRADWANCETMPVVSGTAEEIVEQLASSDGMQHTRSDLAWGQLMRPQFSPAHVVDSSFCEKWRREKGIENCVAYGRDDLLLPVFRGLRVRVGIHTGVADVVEVNPLTRRYTYGGQVAKVAKLVSDAPSGGQIIMSGDTLAQIDSVQDLMARVAQLCAGWRHGMAVGDATTPAAMSVMSLGTHLLEELPPDGQSSMATIESMDGQTREFEESDDALLPPGRTDTMRKSFDTGVIPLTPGSEFILPPTIGDGGGLIPVKSHRMSLGQQLSTLAKCDNFSQLLEQDGLHSAISPVEQERRDQTELERSLRHAHELIMVVPWPLKARALYHPPVKTERALTSSWDKAPAAQGVTILFTFLEGASQLKSLDKKTADQALWRLQSVVRGQLSKNNGYEVEAEEGNFVCAFHSALDSVKFAVDVQSMLVRLKWSPKVLAQPWAAEQRTATNELLFRGLRLAIGMCTGNAARVQPCLRTGKIEYYGPIMNHAARIAVAAHGGQILLHESSWNQVLDARDDVPAEGFALFRNMGKHALKGISRRVFIIQAIPTSLSSRAFPPIKTKNSQNTSASLAMSIGELDRYLAGVGGLPRSLSSVLPEKPMEQEVSSFGRLRRMLALNLPSASVKPSLTSGDANSSLRDKESLDTGHNKEEFDDIEMGSPQIAAGSLADQGPTHKWKDHCLPISG